MLSVPPALRALHAHTPPPPTAVPGVPNTHGVSPQLRNDLSHQSIWGLCLGLPTRPTANFLHQSPTPMTWAASTQGPCCFELPGTLHPSPPWPMPSPTELMSTGSTQLGKMPRH